MEFEFDPAKSPSNEAKHGIDFIEAQALWADGGLVEAMSKASVTDEPRFSCHRPDRRQALDSDLPVSGGRRPDNLGKARAERGGWIL